MDNLCIIYGSGWWLRFQSLWKIWVRPLWWWHSKLNVKIKNVTNHQLERSWDLLIGTIFRWMMPQYLEFKQASLIQCVYDHGSQPIPKTWRNLSFNKLLLNSVHVKKHRTNPTQYPYIINLCKSQLILLQTRFHAFFVEKKLVQLRWSCISSIGFTWSLGSRETSKRHFAL